MFYHYTKAGHRTSSLYEWRPGRRARGRLLFRDKRSVVKPPAGFCPPPDARRAAVHRQFRRPHPCHASSPGLVAREIKGGLLEGPGLSLSRWLHTRRRDSGPPLFTLGALHYLGLIGLA